MANPLIRTNSTESTVNISQDKISDPKFMAQNSPIN